MSSKRTLLICLLVLIVGGGTTVVIFITEPTAEQSGAVRESAMLVEVSGVEQGTFSPEIRAMGTVQPSQDINLSPRIDGEVHRVSSAFTPGGFVRAGQVLIQIDPSDYENVLAQRQSALNQAIADLNIERGRQKVAEEDFALLGDTLSIQNRSLVLREPQLEAARSKVEAARAALNQAELDLERTTIRAPFDAHILTRNVNIGSQVAPGDNLGRLVGVQTYWVVATIPQSQLRWLTFRSTGSTPSSVKIRNRTAWRHDEYRTGTLHELVGALETQTRLARVIIDVPDPMSYLSENTGAPPLMIGSFVEATIQAKELRNVIRLDRNYLRGGDTVWIMEDGLLQIENVDILFQDARYAYLSDGLDANARVVTTNLSTVVDGAPLRTEEAMPAGDDAPLPTAADTSMVTSD